MDPNTKISDMTVGDVDRILSGIALSVGLFLAALVIFFAVWFVIDWIRDR